MLIKCDHSCGDTLEYMNTVCEHWQPVGSIWGCSIMSWWLSHWWLSVTHPIRLRFFYMFIHLNVFINLSSQFTKEGRESDTYICAHVSIPTSVNMPINHILNVWMFRFCFMYLAEAAVRCSSLKEDFHKVNDYYIVSVWSFNQEGPSVIRSAKLFIFLIF